MSSSAQLAPSTEMVVAPAGALQVAAAAPRQEATDAYAWLPCEITLVLPIVGFTIRDLMQMRVGTVLETACKATSDVPVRVNGTLIGWTEFEVIGNTLAVRITELA